MSGTGFRDVLVGGNQGVQVARHVAAAAAITLTYDNWWALPIVNHLDETQTDRTHAHGSHTNLAEVTGNIAGEMVGREIRRYHREQIAGGELRDRLTKILCK